MDINDILILAKAGFTADQIILMRHPQVPKPAEPVPAEPAPAEPVPAEPTPAEQVQAAKGAGASCTWAFRKKTACGA